MKIKFLLFVGLSFLMNDCFAQIGRLPLSPFQRIEQKIGVTDINIEYSRPSMRDREIFGGLVPYNELWRTGANRNTTIEFSEDFMFNGKKIEPGKYAIFTIPGAKVWEVILYAKTDNWNVPDVLDSTQIAGSIKVPSKRSAASLEVFTITIGDFTNEEFALNIAWDSKWISVPFGMVNLKIMDAQIERTLNAPTSVDYYSAASHQMESGKDHAKGLEYINKAIELSDAISWWDLRMKAKLLLKLGRIDEAKAVAKRGLEMLPKDDRNRAYGVREFTQVLESKKE